MTRSVPEWIGKTPDTTIPNRVRLRVMKRAACRCEKCDRLFRPGKVWHVDHIKALANGGLHRESNMQALCYGCHLLKTKKDLAANAKTNRQITSHYGMKQSRWPAMPGTKRSGWRKRMNGTVERRE